MYFVKMELKHSKEENNVGNLSFCDMVFDLGNSYTIDNHSISLLDSPPQRNITITLTMLC